MPKIDVFRLYINSDKSDVLREYMEDAGDALYLLPLGKMRRGETPVDSAWEDEPMEEGDVLLAFEIGGHIGGRALKAAVVEQMKYLATLCEGTLHSYETEVLYVHGVDPPAPLPKRLPRVD